MSSDPQAVPERVQLPESEARKLAHSLAEQYRVELVEQMQAKKRIEALEGEVAALKKTNAEWLKENAPGGWIDIFRSQAREYGARAERLRGALERAKPYVANSVHLTADMKLIEEALEDDKQ